MEGGETGAPPSESAANQQESTSGNVNTASILPPGSGDRRDSSQDETKKPAPQDRHHSMPIIPSSGPGYTHPVPTYPPVLGGSALPRSSQTVGHPPYSAPAPSVGLYTPLPPLVNSSAAGMPPIHTYPGFAPYHTPSSYGSYGSSGSQSYPYNASASMPYATPGTAGPQTGYAAPPDSTGYPGAEAELSYSYPYPYNTTEYPAQYTQQGYSGPSSRQYRPPKKGKGRSRGGFQGSSYPSSSFQGSSYQQGSPYQQGSSYPTSQGSSYHPSSYQTSPYQVQSYSALPPPTGRSFATNPGKPYFKDRNSRRSGPDGANLFVFYIPNDMTNVELLELFSPFGNVLSARIMTEEDTGRGKGFGFVSYDLCESAAEAITALHGFQIQGKRLKVKYKESKESARSSSPAGSFPAEQAVESHQHAGSIYPQQYTTMPYSYDQHGEFSRARASPQALSGTAPSYPYQQQQQQAPQVLPDVPPSDPGLLQPVRQVQASPQALPDTMPSYPYQQQQGDIYQAKASPQALPDTMPSYPYQQQQGDIHQAKASPQALPGARPSDLGMGVHNLKAALGILPSLENDDQASPPIKEFEYSTSREYTYDESDGENQDTESYDAQAPSPLTDMKGIEDALPDVPK